MRKDVIINVNVNAWGGWLINVSLIVFNYAVICEPVTVMADEAVS